MFHAQKSTGFQRQMSSSQTQFQLHNFFHFPQLTALIVSKEIQADKVPIALFCNIFDAVLQDFSDRFQDFEKISKTLRLVVFPHLVETESAPMDLQMELLETKNDEQLVQKFKDEENLLETWKSAIKYPMLRELARETLALFGSTYMCESALSKMKYLKNEYRTRLLDSNLESELRLMVSNETPDFAGLSARMQNQGSH